MCLLLVCFGSFPHRPLVVGANRDERYDRLASTVAVRHLHPRVLAGRDEVAGGTWLAVNEFGVVAGLTNQPSSAGRDPSKRTRGELPLLLTEEVSAAAAVAAFVAWVDPREYNACSILVGDRDSLFSLEVADAPSVGVLELPPGRYALENRQFRVVTSKSEYARRLLDALGTLDDDGLDAGLAAILSDNTPAPRLLDDDERRPPERTSACVHSEGYGTRSSMIVSVPEARDGRPHVLVADGPPCVTPYRDSTDLW